jgi:hypothetical protein
LLQHWPWVWDFGFSWWWVRTWQPSEYHTAWSHWSRPTFQKCVLPSWAGWWWRQYTPLKC